MLKAVRILEDSQDCDILEQNNGNGNTNNIDCDTNLEEKDDEYKTDMLNVLENIENDNTNFDFENNITLTGKKHLN